jgi:hypothetical protein
MQLKHALLFFAAVVAGSVHAQAAYTGKVIETNIAGEAIPRNGLTEFYKTLMVEMEIPNRCMEEGMPSLLKLRFVVDTVGNISQIVSLQQYSFCPEFTAEAIRILMASQPWIPGQKHGKAVNSYRDLSVPICFGQANEQ